MFFILSGKYAEIFSFGFLLCENMINSPIVVDNAVMQHIAIIALTFVYPDNMRYVEIKVIEGIIFPINKPLENNKIRTTGNPNFIITSYINTSNILITIFLCANVFKLFIV